MLPNELAKQKERRISGSHVNYYLVGLANGVIVEIEDIIRYLGMDFSLGTKFKSLVRLCKLRQDLGKPGSDSDYEKGKIVYYSDRVWEITNYNILYLSFWKKTIYKARDILDHRSTYDVEFSEVSIPRPKRLDPYTFVVHDFIEALEPTIEESKLLLNVFTIAMMRQLKRSAWWSSLAELDAAKDSVALAKGLS